MITKGKFVNSYYYREIGLKGMFTGIEPEYLQDGYSPESINLHFTKDGKAISVKEPQEYTVDSSCYFFKMALLSTNEIIIAGLNKFYYFRYGSVSSTVSTTVSVVKNLIPTVFNMVYSVGLPFIKLTYNSSGVLSIVSENKPLNASAGCYYNNRVFVGGIQESDNLYQMQRLRWSPILDLSTLNWYDNDNINNFIDFREGNPYINAVVPYNGRLYIFLNNGKVYVIIGNTPSQFVSYKIFDRFMVIKQDDTAVVDKLYFVDHYTGKVYSLSDSGISYVVPAAGITPTMLAPAGRFLALRDGNTIDLYDTESGIYERFNIDGVTDLKAFTGTDGLPYFAYIKHYGKLGYMFLGNNFLPWTYRTKTITYNAPDIEKRPLSIEIYTDKATTSSTVTVQAYFDDNTTPVDVGYFDPASGEVHNLPIEYGQFKKVYFVFSGNGEIALRGFSLHAKMRRKIGL